MRNPRLLDEDDFLLSRGFVSGVQQSVQFGLSPDQTLTELQERRETY